MIGEQAYIAPDVKIYPFKTVESGAQINTQHHLGVARQRRSSSARTASSGSSTSTSPPSSALKLAMAYGTTLPKGAKVVTSRDAHPASRVIKRAIICGLNSTGVDVRDLRVSSAAVNRFEIKGGNAQGGMHVRISSWDPEMIQIQVFEPPGIPVSEKTQKDIEKYYGRQDFRRAFYSEIGEHPVPGPGHGDLHARPHRLLGHRAHPQRAATGS